MKFNSSRIGSATGRTQVSFRQAVFSPLPPDGGLYVPAAQPDLQGLLETLSAQTGFQELAGLVMAELIGEELSAEAIRRVCEQAFSFLPTLRPLEEELTLLELFHGPTCAFKDFGAAFLAAVMEEFLKEENRRALILVATSGDTGSAVARAFHGREGIDVVILYPSGRVSALQEKQLTTVGDNVQAIEVRGSFDDCQRLVKRAFMDAALRGRLPLSSANSISLGRLLPQALYYIYGALQTGSKRSTLFCVPSGNFGNLTAGAYAWRWGMPAGGFIAATNINDVFPEYLATGEFRPRRSVKTLSNAMDVGYPSNFERLIVLFQGSVRKMRRAIRGIVIDEDQTRRTMREVYEQQGVLLDPHTAVGVAACRRYRKRARRSAQILSLATAHPGKFPEIVREATGASPELPPVLQEALKRRKRSLTLEPDMDRFRQYLLDTYA